MSQDHEPTWRDVVFADPDWERERREHQPLPYVYRNIGECVHEIVRHRSRERSLRLLWQTGLGITSGFLLLGIVVFVMRTQSQAPGGAVSTHSSVVLALFFAGGWAITLLITIAMMKATTPVSSVPVAVLAFEPGSAKRVLCRSSGVSIDGASALRVVRLFVRENKSRSVLVYQLQVLVGPEVACCFSSQADPTEAVRAFASASGFGFESYRFGWSNGPSLEDMDAHCRRELKTTSR